MKYFEHLRFPFAHDYSTLAVWDDASDSLGYTTRKTEIMGDEFVQLLASRGLYASHIALFHTPPRRLLPIHTDTYIIPHFAKLNFVYGAAGSRMFWYKLKPGYVIVPQVTDDQKKYRTPTGSNVAYVSIPGSECFPVASTAIGTPTLVDVGVPHSVLNNTDEHRWCISIPLRSLKDDHVLEFNEAREAFQDLVV